MVGSQPGGAAGAQGYVLHARRLVGSLAAPERNDTEYGEAATLAEAAVLAADLAGKGFTVWIYDHGRAAPLPGSSNLRVVAVHEAVAPGGASSVVRIDADHRLTGRIQARPTTARASCAARAVSREPEG